MVLFSVDDFMEVTNYVVAIHYGYNDLHSNLWGIFVHFRMLNGYHLCLIQDRFGADKQPGEIRF